jgi:hypothetical protein
MSGPKVPPGFSDNADDAVRAAREIAALERQSAWWRWFVYGRPTWLPPWIPWWLGFLLALILLLFALYALYYTLSSLGTKYVERGGPLCMPPVNAATNLGPIEEGATFQNEVQLLNSVMSKAQATCDTYASKCPVVAGPPPCRPNVSVQDLTITNWGFRRWVTLSKYNCTCERY